MFVVIAFYMIGRAINDVTINGIFGAGGDTLFDMYSLAVCMWCLAIPLAAVGTYYFHWPVVVIYACTCIDEVGKRGFEDKSFQKMIQREAYLRQARQQKEIVMHYIKDNKITFSEIEETVTEDTRTVFLQWITQANMNSQKTGRTEYGQEYRLIRKPEKCVLKCEDGKLVMPSYILEFK